MKKLYYIICGTYKNLEKPEISDKKHQLFLLFAIYASMKIIKYLKKKNKLR